MRFTAALRSGSSPQVRGRRNGLAQTSNSRRAHPRRCGADTHKYQTLRSSTGSSPQVRGRRNGHSSYAPAGGLIPAGAGQTDLHVHLSGWAGAHPRRCGADPSRRSTVAFDGGSSPQVRGRLKNTENEPEPIGLIPASAGQTVWIVRRGGRRGLIPAGAGQTGSRGLVGRGRWAHPRRCGADGSGGTARKRRSGLIPAGAGQTRTARHTTGARRAHPRRCGADRCGTTPPLVAWGSSPQVRGRQIHPARCMCPNRAHPRRCGADNLVAGVLRPVLGSSPQVRGRLLQGFEAFRLRGLIPAGAGQTVSPITVSVVVWAHPRRCGADHMQQKTLGLDRGSSPQVRGRLFDDSHNFGFGGLIPAGAGQTTRAPNSSCAARAHPRRCGADHFLQLDVGGERGSSPQVRGRRRRCRTAGCPRGAHPRRCGADVRVVRRFCRV